MISLRQDGVYILWRDSEGVIIELGEEGLGIRHFSMFEGEKIEGMFIKSITKELDDFFEGGLHKGCITQIYGESGCGKSQTAMLFAIGAITRAIPCVYLSTQKQLSWKRFTSLAYNFVNEAQFEQGQKQLIYKKSSDFAGGYSFIEESMAKVKKGGRGGLLIIDSVHAFITSCLEQWVVDNDPFQRSRKQAEIVNRIRWLAKMSSSAVLLINHAADLVDKRRNSGGRNLVPTLGPSWELNIDQSIFLSKKKEVRQLSIVHSPKIPRGRRKRFRIDNDGFVWISEDGVEYIE